MDVHFIRALFANGNRTDYEPIALIEAKKFSNSCLTAEDQVRNYATVNKTSILIKCYEFSFLGQSTVSSRIHGESVK